MAVSNVEPQIKAYGGVAVSIVEPQIKAYGGVAVSNVEPQIKAYGGVAVSNVESQIKAYGGVAVSIEKCSANSNICDQCTLQSPSAVVEHPPWVLEIAGLISSRIIPKTYKMVETAFAPLLRIMGLA